MQSDHNAAPLNPVPLVVWALVLPMIAMEIVLSLGASGLMGGPGAVGWRLDAVERFAFFPELWQRLWSAQVFPPDHMLRFVAYPFVHGTFTHLAFVVVLTLALGKMVAEVFRFWAVLVVFFGAAVTGALAYGAVPGLRAPLIGGYPAVYGLIGAFTFLLWVNLAAVGANKFRAFTLIGLLLGLQLVWGLAFGGGWDWVAEIAGFATGFFLSFLVSPGGAARVLQKLRQR
ncbi:MAG: rhomboid family intramembrane serine protease [Paracoccaceae bacterium]